MPRPLVKGSRVLNTGQSCQSALFSGFSTSQDFPTIRLVLELSRSRQRSSFVDSQQCDKGVPVGDSEGIANFQPMECRQGQIEEFVVRNGNLAKVTLPTAVDETFMVENVNDVE